MIGRFIANQFRRPSGLIGRMIGNGMARSMELYPQPDKFPGECILAVK